jgi:S1-C subfamily serine protease
MRMVRLPALALLIVAAAAGVPAASGAADSANLSVFQLLTQSRTDGAFPTSGTAFFTSSDGTALTNSHLVYLASSDPARYQLIALYRREFFSVTVVCASRLPEPPSPDTAPSRFARDVAEIRLQPWKTAGITVIQFRDGPEFTAHIARLPVFPPLRLGGDPRQGMPVRVTGYGEHLGTRPWAQWTTPGVVTTIAKAEDGTPLIRITSTDAPRPGSSGSPVLDDQGRVVGIIAWTSRADLSFSAGMAGSTLKAPCGF